MTDPFTFQNLNPRKMQINLTGFLNGKNARVFMQELWDLLCSASTNPSGIPDSFIEQKKDEIKKRNVSSILGHFFAESLITCPLCALYLSRHPVLISADPTTLRRISMSGSS